jgi:hypothetical protein
MISADIFNDSESLPSCCKRGLWTICEGEQADEREHHSMMETFTYIGT